MNKSKISGLVGFCIIVAILTISANSIMINKSENTSNSYRDIRHFGINEFIKMDLGLIGYFPKNKQWKQISENIRIVPIDSLRYIDSLDVNKLGDTLYVKVYSQNFAYQSNNIYKITKDANNSTDTLKIYNISIDLKMKDIIDDAETFRVKNFTVDYVSKQNIDKIDKRIIFNKNYR
jgi:hypothetical protein